MATCGSILVTGGAGYVGSHTLLELINSDYTVIVLDNYTNCAKRNSEGKPTSIEVVETMTNKSVLFYNVNVTDEEMLRTIFLNHKIDIVIHLAALKYIAESKITPLDYYHTNVVGSCSLFQVMNEFKVKHLIFSSTSNVYGTPQFLPISENHPTGQYCTSPYGRSKYFVEEMLKDICKSDSEWKVICLRYFAPSGSHESGVLGEHSVTKPNNTLAQLAQVGIGIKEDINVFQSKDEPKNTSVRDYTHIMDIAAGHVQALLRIKEESFNGWTAYNLGTGKGYSTLEVIHHFSKTIGRCIKYNLDSIKNVDLVKMVADVSKARKELHWTALRNLDDMCQDIWKWQCNQTNNIS